MYCTCLSNLTFIGDILVIQMLQFHSFWGYTERQRQLAAYTRLFTTQTINWIVKSFLLMEERQEIRAFTILNAP